MKRSRPQIYDPAPPIDTRTPTERAFALIDDCEALTQHLKETLGVLPRTPTEPMLESQSSTYRCVRFRL